MFLLTRSSNNFVLLALERNAASRKKSCNIIAFKQVISRIFTGLDIVNDEEMHQIVQAALFTRIRPELAVVLKNGFTNVHKPGLLGALWTSHSSGLQSRLFHTRAAAKRPNTIGGGTGQQAEQQSNNEACIKDEFFGRSEPTVMFYMFNFGKKFAAFIIIGSVIYLVVKIIAKNGFGVGGVILDLVGGGDDMFTVEQEVNDITLDDEEAKLEVQEIEEAKLKLQKTAYHEAGHAIVAMFTKHAHPLHRVTIISRGATLGHTAQLPLKGQLQMTKAQMLAQLDVSMGGHVAEELIFGDENITTGASSDFKRAISIAESMVNAFGMSDRRHVGLRDFTTTVYEMELGTNGCGPDAEEIRGVLQESYDRAKELLLKYKNEHRLLAEALLEYETLNRQEAERVIKGEKLKKLKPTQKTTGTEIRGRKQPVNAGSTFFPPDRRTTD